MAWKNCVALLAIMPRRRVIGTALVYGLSFSVRFTSATGEEIEIPTLATTSIVTRDGARVLRDGWPLEGQRADRPPTRPVDDFARLSRLLRTSNDINAETAPLPKRATIFVSRLRVVTDREKPSPERRRQR